MENQRDTRLDLFRALALITIFIDHIPGTIFERLTIRNFGFSDAAEVFVLISGIAVGLAYAPKFGSGGSLLASFKLIRRAGVLYCTHIMTTVATLTIFCGASILFSRPDLLKLNNIEALIDEPAKAFLGVGLMGHQLGYNNILSMYAVLMLATPLMIWGLRRAMRITLLISGLVWLAAGIWKIAPPNYPTEGLWFLNPLSWQFLFVIAIAATMHVQRGGTFPRSRLLNCLAVIYLLGALAWVHSPLWGLEGWRGLPVVIAGFDKAFLPLPRLLDVLALAWLATQARWIAAITRVSPDNALAILGKHSLPVFILGTVLAMVAQVLKTLYGHSFVDDAALVFTGMAAQFTLAYGLEWVARASRQQTKTATSVPAVAA